MSDKTTFSEDQNISIHLNSFLNNIKKNFDPISIENDVYKFLQPIESDHILEIVDQIIDQICKSAEAFENLIEDDYVKTKFKTNIKEILNRLARIVAQKINSINNTNLISLNNYLLRNPDRVTINRSSQDYSYHFLYGLYIQNIFTAQGLDSIGCLALSLYLIGDINRNLPGIDPFAQEFIDLMFSKKDIVDPLEFRFIATIVIELTNPNFGLISGQIDKEEIKFKVDYQFLKWGLYYFQENGESFALNTFRSYLNYLRRRFTFNGQPLFDKYFKIDPSLSNFIKLIESPPEAIPAAILNALQREIVERHNYTPGHNIPMGIFKEIDTLPFYKLDMQNARLEPETYYASNLFESKDILGIFNIEENNTEALRLLVKAFEENDKKTMSLLELFYQILHLFVTNSIVSLSTALVAFFNIPFARFYLKSKSINTDFFTKTIDLNLLEDPNTPEGDLRLIFGFFTLDYQTEGDLLEMREIFLALNSDRSIELFRSFTKFSAEKTLIYFKKLFGINNDDVKQKRLIEVLDASVQNSSLQPYFFAIFGEPRQPKNEFIFQLFNEIDITSISKSLPTFPARINLGIDDDLAAILLKDEEVIRNIKSILKKIARFSPQRKESMLDHLIKLLNNFKNPLNDENSKILIRKYNESFDELLVIYSIRVSFKIQVEEAFIIYLLERNCIVEGISYLKVLDNSLRHSIFNREDFLDPEISFEIIKFYADLLRNPLNRQKDFSKLFNRLSQKLSNKAEDIIDLFELLYQAQINLITKHSDLFVINYQEILPMIQKGDWSLIHLAYPDLLVTNSVVHPINVEVKNVVESPDFLSEFNMIFMQDAIASIDNLRNDQYDFSILAFDHTIHNVALFLNFKLARVVASLYYELIKLFTEDTQGYLNKDLILDFYLKILKSNIQSVDYLIELINSSLGILKISPSIFSHAVELSENADLQNSTSFRELVDSFFKPLRNLLILHKAAGHTANNQGLKSIIPLRIFLKSILGNASLGYKDKIAILNARFQEEFRDIFQKGLGLKVLPDLNDDSMAKVESLIIYLGNINLDNVLIEGYPYDDVLRLLIGLIIHNKWNAFRKGESIDYAYYFTDDLISKIQPILDSQAKIDEIFKDLGLDQINLDRLKSILNEESENTYLTDSSEQNFIEEVSSYVETTLVFEDEDYYLANAVLKNLRPIVIAALNGELDLKSLNRNLGEWFSRKINSLPSELIPVFSIDFPENIENVKNVQKILGLISKVITLKKTIKSLINLNKELDIAIKEKRKDLIKTLVDKKQTYIEDLKEIIVALQRLVNGDSIAPVFTPFISIIDTKIKTLSDIIRRGQVEAEIMTTMLTADLSVVAENARECLSCKTTEINNDTHVSLADPTRLFITTRSAKTERSKSISDQLIYFLDVEFNGKKEKMFVMDKIYGVISSGLVLAHLKILIDKVQSIFESTGIMFKIIIPDVVLESLINKPEIETEYPQLQSSYEGDLTAVFNNTNLGEYYCEIDGKFSRRAPNSKTDFKGRVFELQNR